MAPVLFGRQVTQASPQRLAVVDLGSNSVRLVVFEGRGRNPHAIFNEKAILGLGRGLDGTGRLNEQAMDDTLVVLDRYAAVAEALGAGQLNVLATAAVRDASNGPAFVQALRRRQPDALFRVLDGAEEAALSAEGVLCGIPEADGVLGDLGGGSLELVRLQRGLATEMASLKLGAVRLAEQSGGDVVRARAIAENTLASVPWLKEGAERDLYLVGGAWRGLARIHIAQTGYPLAVVHHYTLSRDEARDLTGVMTGLSRRALERIPGIPRRRIDSLPFAAMALRRLLRVTNARRVVFSANGLREGWYMRHLDAAVRAEDPLLAAARGISAHTSRHAGLPPALARWTAPLFPGETASALRLREAACLASDVGAGEHPEYRAEQGFCRLLRLPEVGLDHHARAFLALVVALRYDADIAAPFTQPARALLDVASAKRAETLGVALRLAYTLSAGTPELLARTAVRLEPGRLVLRMAQGGGVFAGESVWRRLERLATALDLEPATEIAPLEAAAE